ncbi:MAG: NAD(P)/FAD-dependent oxidoreductase [Sphingomonadaceae bacterium]|nr:NAD(P)/FAD-dependent oxidoreductase [Sphingomonadaceae bacterium]
MGSGSGRGGPITRRDFVNGVAVGAAGVAASAWLPGMAAADTVQQPPGAASYPPLRTGLRGSHPGSFEMAHVLRDGGHPGRGAPADTGEHYDLVVVGGGISGLAAAHFFREAKPQAKILILDNHDDFGGHAKRNEFHPVRGATLLCNGGTLGIDSPYPYSPQADGLLKAIGIDAAALKPIEKEDVYAARGLGRAIFFDKATFGRDHLAVGAGTRPFEQLLAGAPLSDKAKQDIATIESGGGDYLPGLGSAEKKDRLSRMSYKAYLADHAKADAQALAYFQPRSQGWWGVGIDAITALDAWGMGFPGFEGLKLDKGGIPRMGFTPRGYADTGGSYTLHLPDGNATIARRLVGALVPGALPAGGVADTMLAPVDYTMLDRPGQRVRIRLSSIVVAVHHEADPRTAKGVDITYVAGSDLRKVHAGQVIMASWNMMIPYVVPELPEPQKAALHALVKAPLVYTSVALAGWQAFDRLKVAQVYAPGCFFTDYRLNEMVDIGGYATPRDPTMPTVVRMEHVPCMPGLPEFDQNRAGRAELLATPFETFEHHVRDELGRALGQGGFDPDRDVTAITVNRWPHGYAPEYNPLWEELLPDAQQPTVIARARFGRIAIANADSGRGAYTNVAIDQAHRAVAELLG